jgi:hypothetical protein
MFAQIVDKTVSGGQVFGVPEGDKGVVGREPGQQVKGDPDRHRGEKEAPEFESK